MPGPLLGKVAFVTGAGSGIGRAICRVMSRDGAHIVAADKNLASAQETIATLGSEALALEVDVSSTDSVAKALSATLDKYKRPPGVIVNSAGIVRDNYFLKMPEKDFDAVYKVNLKGTFLVMQYFAKSLVEYKKTGTIINLSSIIAKINNVGQANYTASKSGVISLTKVAAKEFGKFNIRVNAVLPGFIDTPMVAGIPDKAKEAALASCPLNRLGKPEEIAEVIAFLASDKASYINGATIEVTGGL
ncbi:unnamed protein product [Hermetia illucens]|uniref:(3R)-3-hydroxyacyl-CoA dehydrogenase n=1 Tax=Hermetia illucens TaxID=343691 RepID=A0A7R8V2U1_HERIL|nr:estradiol 17-beta-dehydrogenase 8 [Hermetia illucens]CAD7090957.1 unnamed protein product [Hermetia illucens]